MNLIGEVARDGYSAWLGWVFVLPVAAAGVQVPSTIGFNEAEHVANLHTQRVRTNRKNSQTIGVLLSWHVPGPFWLGSCRSRC